MVVAVKCCQYRGTVLTDLEVVRWSGLVAELKQDSVFEQESHTSQENAHLYVKSLSVETLECAPAAVVVYF